MARGEVTVLFVVYIMNSSGATHSFIMCRPKVSKWNYSYFYYRWGQCTITATTSVYIMNPSGFIHSIIMGRSGEVTVLFVVYIMNPSGFIHSTIMGRSQVRSQTVITPATLPLGFLSLTLQHGFEIWCWNLWSTPLFVIATRCVYTIYIYIYIYMYSNTHTCIVSGGRNVVVVGKCTHAHKHTNSYIRTYTHTYTYTWTHAYMCFSMLLGGPTVTKDSDLGQLLNFP